MKQYRCFYTYTYENSRCSVKEVLVDLKREDLLEHLDRYGELKYEFDADDFFVEKLKWILKKNRINCTERIERKFTIGELKKCTLLRMGLCRAQYGTGGPLHGTAYDMSEACKSCGTGAKQKGPLMMIKSEIPKNKDAFQNYDDETMVSKTVKDSLSEKNFRGLEFRQIMGSGKPVEYYQLMALNTLPPMSESTKGKTIDEQCDNCHRNGHFDTPDFPSEIHYDKIDEELLAKADVFFTYEWFGYSTVTQAIDGVPICGDSRKRIKFSNPRMVVKPEFMVALKEAKAKGFFFEPVIVNGCPDLKSMKKPMKS